MERNEVLASGKQEVTTVPVTLQSNVDEKVATRASEIVAGMQHAYNTIASGYFQLLPYVAKAIGEETYKNYVGVSNTNQLIKLVCGCSKATASQLVKVANVFYSTDGTLLDDSFGVFSYSELIQISKLDYDQRKAIASTIAKMESHTRKDVIALVKDYCEPGNKIEDKNEGGSTVEPEESTGENENDNGLTVEPEESTGENENDNGLTVEPEESTSENENTGESTGETTGEILEENEEHVKSEEDKAAEEHFQTIVKSVIHAHSCLQGIEKSIDTLGSNASKAIYQTLLKEIGETLKVIIPELDFAAESLKNA